VTEGISGEQITVTTETERGTLEVLTIRTWLKHWIGDNRPRTQSASTNIINIYYEPNNPQTYGNCVLAQITPSGYILITGDILYFETDDPIQDLFSAMTNNGMIIPIIVGTDRVYCFYWGGFSFPRSDLTLDPLYHSYDDRLTEGTCVPACHLVPDSSEMWDMKPAGRIEWHNRKFSTLIFDQDDVPKGIPGSIVIRHHL
jgi:hypothetical protein